MTTAIEIYECPECERYSEKPVEICKHCGCKPNEQWVEITIGLDGAPTGSSDPDYANGFRDGQRYGNDIEYNRIQKNLQSYFDLSLEPNENEETEHNPEWDRGFQAAMAIARSRK